MKFNRPRRKRCTLRKATEQIKELIYSAAYKKRSRKRPKDFTRERKLPFGSMICFMMNQIKQSTQTALDHFFELMGKDEVHMSQQSFSEARQKLKWEACRELMDFTVQCVYGQGYSTWHVYRVWAVDGSTMQLPSDSDLLKVFGAAGRGKTAATARASCLYDVLNDIIADARLMSMETDERSLALIHVGHLCGMDSFGKELLIPDRGYPSFELIEQFEVKHIHYLMRVRMKFNCDIDNMSIGNHAYSLVHEGKQIPVRIIRFHLPGGEIETLITNLFDKRMGSNAFKELYFKRWPVETKYGELKHKLELEIENFSGRTEQSIYQDYYISAYLSNMIAIAANETQPIIDELRENKETLYDYKMNKNHAVGVFKDRFIVALLEERPRKRDRAISRILFLLTKHPTPIRPDRSVPRNPNPRAAHFHFNQKSNC